MKHVILTLLIFLVMLPGCAKKHWESSWHDAKFITAPAPTGRLYAQARAKIGQASDQQGVESAMDALQQVLAADPFHKKALAYLGNLHILLGTAYTVDRKEKISHFRQAQKYCERSMYVNPQFKAAADAGKKPWEAAPTLRAEDAPAMLFWVIALQYEFKEGMTMPDKIINVGWMKRGIVFLDQIVRVAPEFGNGTVEFAYSICYGVLPFFLGGDTHIAKAYMKKAVDRGKGYLLPRWGRGKYFHQVTGDMESARQDLNWVAGQNIEEVKDPYPWRVHFINDARAELDGL
ncbi:MAG: hypothetical protein MI799_10825 [Desulfobacterales bacterium]|nr:hypothetical protein [Desulfobacterales bacterium]